MSAAVHAVSAPGKVLIAGGYLVLDRAYTGLVFGLDARIHVIIEDIKTSKGVTLSEIVVRSPQFAESTWHYTYRASNDDGGVEVTQLSIGADQPLNANPFVETTLRYALSYVVSSLQSPSLPPSTITILADNDYYTTPEELPEAERFYNFNIALSKANKTGLGSSAALVTSLTAALLRHYLPGKDFDLTSSISLQRLHNLAQAAHCAAQGKVGSGFDVASAVFGSCIYRRFSPDILSALPDPGVPGFATSLAVAVNEANAKWDHEIGKDQVAVPKGLRMIMCDVSCGSQTPGMVKKVLAWRKTEPVQAETIWKDLHTANLELARALQNAVNNTSANHRPIAEAFDHIRQHIRLMGEHSDVPIEPPAQTKLIDACAQVDGVIGGTVPGAGGYDAIVLLVEDKPEVFSALNQLFADWQFGNESGGQGKVSILRVREEMQGVKDEDPSSYGSWSVGVKDKLH